MRLAEDEWPTAEGYYWMALGPGQPWTQVVQFVRPQFARPDLPLTLWDGFGRRTQDECIGEGLRFWGPLQPPR